MLSDFGKIPATKIPEPEQEWNPKNLAERKLKIYVTEFRSDPACDSESVVRLELEFLVLYNYLISSFYRHPTHGHTN